MLNHNKYLQLVSQDTNRYHLRVIGTFSEGPKQSPVITQPKCVGLLFSLIDKSKNPSKNSSIAVM